jgi:ketosteroid isomerase-like protein
VCKTLKVLAAGFLVLLSGWTAAAATPEEIRNELIALEQESHQRWLEGDVPALGEIMADEFHFVAMNGALEPRAFILGGDPETAGQRVLQVESLRVEPEEVLLRGDTAVVIALLHIEATVRGRPLPSPMRILSIFTRTEEDRDWRLTARSITPILGR